MDNQSRQLEQNALQLRMDEVSSMVSSFWKEVGWLKGSLVQVERGTLLISVGRGKW